MPLSRRRLLTALGCSPFAGCAAAPPPPAAPIAADPLDVRVVPPWRAALGPLDDVDPPLRVAFTDAHGHTPLPPPVPRSWRVLRPEPPQTVLDFIASGPNARAAPRDRIVVLPLGAFPLDVVADDGFRGVVRTPELPAIAAMLSACFATPVDMRPQQPFPTDLVPRRISRGASQYDARALLDLVAPHLPPDAHSMLMLVNVDLFVWAEQHYAFGWSTLRDRLGVVGFARLDPLRLADLRPADAPAALLRRGLCTAVHEVGHMFGLGHCQAFRCVMNGIADLADLDATPLHLCPLCLRKLHLVTGLDPRARDAELLRVCQDLGLAAESRWLADRHSRLWRRGPLHASG